MKIKKLILFLAFNVMCLSCFLVACTSPTQENPQQEEQQIMNIMKEGLDSSAEIVMERDTTN